MKSEELKKGGLFKRGQPPEGAGRESGGADLRAERATSGAWYRGGEKGRGKRRGGAGGISGRCGIKTLIETGLDLEKPMMAIGWGPRKRQYGAAY